jgi:hypothetical protein
MPRNTTTKEAPVCLCGCGEPTKGGRFRPGHDARLKSDLRTKASGTNSRVATAATKRLKELGWA